MCNFNRLLHFWLKPCVVIPLGVQTTCEQSQPAPAAADKKTACPGLHIIPFGTPKPALLAGAPSLFSL